MVLLYPSSNISLLYSHLDCDLLQSIDIALIYLRPYWQCLNCVTMFYIYVLNNVLYHSMSGHLNGMLYYWKEVTPILDALLALSLSLSLCLLYVYVCMMCVHVCGEARVWFWMIYLSTLHFIDWDRGFHLNSWIISLASPESLSSILNSYFSAFTLLNMYFQEGTHTLSTFMWVLGNPY